MATRKSVVEPELSPRQQLLTEAFELTSKDRNNSYGSPEDNFQNIADYWNTYMSQRGIIDTHHVNTILLTAQDVGQLMILLKMARIATNLDHRDSLVDIAGYAACAEDCRVASNG
jgi:hypothetical protein